MDTSAFAKQAIPPNSILILDIEKSRPSKASILVAEMVWNVP